MKPAICIVFAVLVGVTLAVADRLEDTSYVPYEHKAIQYFETPTDEAVKRLDDSIDQGKAKLDFEPGGLGYLRDLLKQLGLNVDSQVMVFSQTSFQATLISPQRPRAVYFNDEISVGFVPHGEVMEVSSLDPKQGVIFYTLNTARAAKPTFARREVCLQCHQAWSSVRSTFPRECPPNTSEADLSPTIGRRLKTAGAVGMSAGRLRVRSIGVYL
jgi:hypothetical protein